MENKLIIIGLITLFTSMSSCCLPARLLNKKCDETRYYLKGGANASTFKEKSDDGEYSYGSSDNSSRTGFQASTHVILPLNENLSLETGLGFASKGNKTDLGGGDENTTRMSYLEAPVLARYQFNNTGFSTFAGVQPGYLLSAKSKIEGNEIEDTTRDVKDNFKNFDAAAVLGAGYQFGNGLRLDASYDFGFVNIVDTDTPGFGEIRNRSFKISLGYVFGGANN